MIVELVGMAVVGYLGTCLGWRLRAPPPGPTDDRIEFNGSWRTTPLKNGDPSQIYAYRCPACSIDMLRESFRPKLCECAEHPKAHFHFACKTCGFTALMKTATDALRGGGVAPKETP
jgi:hypothetical protein